MIKPNEVAFIKTTGEAVFVLSLCEDTPCAAVRRPVAGQDGIRHEREQFFLAELETLDEQRKRFMAEREEVMKKYGPSKDAETAAAPNPGFDIN